MAILRPYLAIFSPTIIYLSQNWDSDSYFEVLNESKSLLVQKLWHKMQKTQMSVFVQNCKKTEMEIFAFCVITFEPIRI